MKQRRNQIMMLAGIVVLFLGLVVMAVTLYFDENTETTAGMVCLFCGLGLFLGGGVVVVIAGVLDRRSLKKEKNALPHNAILLFNSFIATFTQEGLEVVRKGEFPGSAECIPYSEIKVYHARIFKSPRAKGKEEFFLRIPDSTLFSGPDAGLGTIETRADGKSLQLAREYGVEVIEKLQTPSEMNTCHKKFVWREKGQLKQAVFMTAAAVAVIAGAIGLGLALESGNTGVVSGVGGGVSAILIVNAVRLYSGDCFDVYSDGIYIRMTAHGNLVKRFLPLGQIEYISRKQLGIFVSTGYEGFYFYDVDEIWECLEAHFPDKIKE